MKNVGADLVPAPVLIGYAAGGWTIQDWNKFGKDDIGLEYIKVATSFKHPQVQCK